MIYNKKYNFIFNHESPGHANLFVSQNWTKGINHYIMNDYEEFINRNIADAYTLCNRFYNHIFNENFINP
jgi:GDP-D-mannose dehydratase